MENLIELVVSVRVIRGTFGRYPLRRVCFVFRKVVLENFRKITLKVFCGERNSTRVVLPKNFPVL